MIYSKDRKAVVDHPEDKNQATRRNIDSHFYLAHGLGFLQASKILYAEKEHITSHHSAPILFNIGHALELIFKAFLLSKGFDETKLKKTIGHDLSILMKAAQGFDLLIHSENVQSIDEFNKYYQKHYFRFPISGSILALEWGELIQLADSIYAQVYTKMGSS